MPAPEQLEEAARAGFDVACGVVGAVVGRSEQKSVQLVELGPLVAVRSRQAEQRRRRGHGAEARPVEQASRQSGPDQLGPRDAPVKGEVVGDHRVLDLEVAAQRRARHAG